MNEESLGLAKDLIKRKAAKFDPSKFKDGYEVALRELVEAKVNHAPVPKDEPVAPARGKVINLMDALRKSVGNVGADEAPAAAERRRRRRPRRLRRRRRRGFAGSRARRGRRKGGEEEEVGVGDLVHARSKTAR